MAYSLRKDGLVSGQSYLDGIPVKISEKFRPPRKVTLPLSYQHHYPVELLNEEYDFSLEKNVLEMAELKRRNRETADNAKADKLATSIEEFTRSEIEDSSGKNATSYKGMESQQNINGSRVDEDASVKQNFESSTNNTDSEISMSTSLLTSLEPNSILKPIPSTNNASDKPDVTMTCKLNLEDFEAESSPFDSMALKTLNDIEELKSVLQNANVSGNNSRYADLRSQSNETTSASMPDSTTVVGGVDSDSYNISYVQNLPNHSWTPPTSNFLHSKGGAVSFLPLKSSPNDELSAPLKSSHSTPDILKEIGPSLAAERERKKLAASQPKRPNSVGPTNSTESEISHKGISNSENYEKVLKDELVDLVEHITDMGFPRAQVLYAVQQFGADDKKVIEHLCMVQTMIELGYDCADVEAALLVNNHNEAQTKEYLRLLVQFRHLGFDDASIKNALQRFNNDRDKALDFLVT